MFQDVCRWVSYYTIVIVQVIKTVLCSSMYCHLFLISSASLRSLLFLSFITPILVWNVLWIPPVFLKRSLVFPLLLFSSISFHCSVKKALSLLAILCNSALSWMYLSLSPLLFTSLLSSDICKASCNQITTLPSCFSFSLEWFFFFFLPPVQYYSSLSIVLQAHWRINPLNLFIISTAYS